MSSARAGRRRPRLGLIGFSEAEETTLRSIFPTVWADSNPTQLWKQVDPAELDLVASVRQWSADARRARHVVVFGNVVRDVVDSDKKIRLITAHVSTGEEYSCPPVPEELRPLQRALAHWIGHQERSARGINVILAVPQEENHRSASAAEALQEKLDSGALVLASIPTLPLATIVVDAGCTTAYLPCANDSFDRVFALRCLAAYLAKADAIAFPPLQPWEESPRWKTRSELLLLAELERVRLERDELLSAFEAREREIDACLAAEREVGNRGPRRLLTAQSDDLVDAVREAMEAFGFEVHDCDEAVRSKGEAKVEDLWLRVPGEGEMAGWLALVEVKGEKARNARWDHLYQLHKHATAFAKREGREASKLILVSNGVFGRAPDDRPRPFAGAEKEISGFTEDGHLVIPTTDLFEMRRDVGAGLDAAEARRVIVESAGVLRYEGNAARSSSEDARTEDEIQATEELDPVG